MAILHRYRQLSGPEVIPDVSAMLEANGDHYRGVRIRCVAYRDGDLWRNEMCVIQAYPSELAPEPQGSLDYGWAALLESWLDCECLPSLVLSVRDGHLEVGGRLVTMDLSNPFGIANLLPSDNEHSPYPGRQYIAGAGQPHWVPPESFVAYDLPIYSGINDAVQGWTGLGSATPDRMSRQGFAYLFLPECRARFSSLDLSRGKLTIVVAATPELAGLRIKGTVKESGAWQHFELSADPGSVQIDCPPRIEELQAYLVGPDDTLYDYHHEPLGLAFGRRTVLRRIGSGAAGADIVLEALCTGEGETTEFKPYITPGDQKQDEIVETAIAFANTRGGNILVGVGDHCSLEGIQTKIRREAAKHQQTYEETLQHYIGALRQLLAASINRPVPVEFQPVEIANCTLLLITVAEGREKPYARLRDNAIFVRHTATNVFPESDSELGELLQRRSLSWWGQDLGAYGRPL